MYAHTKLPRTRTMTVHHRIALVRRISEVHQMCWARRLVRCFLCVVLLVISHIVLFIIASHLCVCCRDILRAVRIRQSGAHSVSIAWPRPSVSASAAHKLSHTKRRRKQFERCARRETANNKRACMHDSITSPRGASAVRVQTINHRQTLFGVHA